MKRRLLYCSVFAFVLVVTAAGQSLAAPEARLLDAKGKLIATVPTLWLARGHLAIPATAYRHFGLHVSYDDELQMVFLSIPESCANMGFRARGRRSYNLDVGYWPERSSYSLALKRNGHFYVSVREVEEGFEYFTTTWDAVTKSLTLKKRAFKNEGDAGEE